MHFNSRPSARGDTPPQAARPGTADISIHAPPRGATESSPRNTARRRYFNSRPSARGDLFRLQRDYHGALISIHAPPRGATRRHKRPAPARQTFQFTPLREGRPRVLNVGVSKIGKFQFTPLREGRLLQHSPKSAQRVYFNSRPSARGDKCINHTVSVEHISIHAPPRGATTR